MEMKKLLLKSSLLLGSVFLLTACGSNETTEETTVAETTAAVEETTVAETTEAVEETTEADSEEETTEADSEEETTEADSEEETTEADSEEETTEADLEEETTEADSEEETTEADSEEETTEADSEEETTEADSVEETTEADSEEETTDEESEVATDGLQDGTYTVVGNPDERGWAVKHTIEVKDGKVTTSDFDYYNEAGDRKTEDEEYNKNMKDKSGVSAKEAIEQLNEALVEGQEAEVEVVSGATHTAENFVKSATALLEKAAKGDTEETNIDEVALVDGEYTLKSNEDERGWAHTFTLVVKDGKVAESKYDMVDKDGNLKSENEEYNTSMKEKSGASFAEAVEALNAGLVEKQSTDLEVVSGATSTYDAFVEYANLLLEAAAKGDTETIEVEVAAE